MRIGSVCSGVGAMDLGFERAGCVVAWQAEIDPWACRVLAKRWPGVPNVGDWTAWEPEWDASDVDLLIGGIPCQGHSVAGRREGKDDERNLWPAFADLVDALQPRAFVIENVPGLLTSNDGDFFADLLEDCDRLGYSAEWDILAASAVGAPHRRERVFIVGRNDGAQTWPQREQPSLFPGRPQAWPKAGRWTGGTLHERERQWPTPSGAHWPTPRTSDTNGAGEHGQGGMDLRTAVQLQDCARLSPDWAETLMGLPRGWTDPDCDEPEPLPYPLPMACGAWPTPQAQDTERSPEAHLAMRKALDGGSNREVTSLNVAVRDQRPLYGASPQAPWEPPRLVEPVKGDGRRHRLRCIGNAVVPQVAEVIARSVVASFKFPTAEQIQAAQPSGDWIETGQQYTPWATPRASDRRSGKVSDATFDANARPLCEQVERGASDSER